VFDEVITTDDLMVVQRVFLTRAPEHDVKGVGDE
jgi:hypothetical protein